MRALMIQSPAGVSIAAACCKLLLLLLVLALKSQLRVSCSINDAATISNSTDERDTDQGRCSSRRQPSKGPRPLARRCVVGEGRRPTVSRDGAG